MTGPTTQEYQPLSQALQFQSQPELPRLQLAPPEHQKQLPQTQAKQQQEAQEQQQQPQSSASPAAQRPDERATSRSSREVSPVAGAETTQPPNGQKRKSDLYKGASFKKRKTDQVQEQVNDVPVQYGLGTHYPYAYTYPGAAPPPPIPGFNPPQAPNAAADMSFNEFQWRLLNLCGEFYEAATELLRSTPHLVLSQAFQILDRGTGLDPISVLNDARRTCDMLLTNPQALSTPPPPPTALVPPALTSLAHLGSRPSTSSAPTPTIIPPPSYYPPQSPSLVVESFNPKSKEKERAPSNVQGTWKDEEIQKLKALAEKYKVVGNIAVAEEEEEEEEDAPAADGSGKSAEGENAPKPPKKPKTSEIGEVDWDKVITEFGDGRSRHQVLIKATYLGLKPSSSLPGKKPKRKKTVSTATLPPPLTFSSASAKSIPTGYNPPHLNNAQSPSATPNVAASTPTASTAQLKPTTITLPSPANNSHKAAAPPLPVPQHHIHAHAPYSQPGWYPHPQNPYYAYHHQPMYYSPHPQGYGMQGYGMQPPPQGYYPPPYAVPPGTDVPPAEKQVQVKGRRKEVRKDDTSIAASSATPVPPPSLPPKVPPADTTSTVKPPAPSTTGASKSADAPASGTSTPQLVPSLPSANTPTGTGSSGVLRRGPNNSLFTYTPLSHGSGTSTEQAKDA